MSSPYINEIRQTKGMKNNEDEKNVSPEYFYKIKNFNFPKTGLTGLDSILYPSRVSKLASTYVDGMYEYRFLDNSSMPQVFQMGLCNGSLYKNILTTPVLVGTGMQKGKCWFRVYNDNLFIFNGKDYPYIYYGALNILAQMGAPYVQASTTSGSLNGDYFYAMTYTTSGGDEVIGTISNTVTVSNKQMTLNLPLGFTGTTSRKIYRTKAGGTALYLVTTIGNNTTLTYTDTTSDNLLVTLIPSVINNACPKPYFAEVANQKLYGAKLDLNPTQIAITATNVQVFDNAANIDVSNYGNDNTAVNGIGTDFYKVAVGTARNIIFLDPSTGAVNFTRANVGIKDGYSIQLIPAYGEFNGGLLFVATDNNVRLLEGMQAYSTVVTTLDNIRTSDFAQNIRGTLVPDLSSSPNISSAYFDYKYHLLVGANKYVFDIRTKGWTWHSVYTAAYRSMPWSLAVIGNNLYNGQVDGWIEQEYVSTQYRGQDVEASLETPYMLVSEKYNFIEKYYFWFQGSVTNSMTLDVICDNNDNKKFNTTATFNVKGGAFDSRYFDSKYFQADVGGQQFRAMNIYKNARWVKYRLRLTSGSISFKGSAIKAQLLPNKEFQGNAKT